MNRISIPLEQDIVNIQTAFTVGTEPSMDCIPTDDDEKKLLDAVKAVFKSNKIKYQNKKIVRAWLSEQEAAEYWYVTDDDSFWAKFWKKVKTTFGGKVKPTKKLKSVLWSPFRGDKLYPFFNDEGKMIAFSREYKKKLMDDSEVTCFMTITDKMVYQWDLSKGYEERTRENCTCNRDDDGFGQVADHIENAGVPALRRRSDISGNFTHLCIHRIEQPRQVADDSVDQNALKPFLQPINNQKAAPPFPRRPRLGDGAAVYFRIG